MLGYINAMKTKRLKGYIDICAVPSGLTSNYAFQEPAVYFLRAVREDYSVHCMSLHLPHTKGCCHRRMMVDKIDIN